MTRREFAKWLAKAGGAAALLPSVADAITPAQIGAAAAARRRTVAYTPVVSSRSGGSTRNESTIWVGFKFTVGASNLTVKQLGRWIISENSGTHTVHIRNSSGTVVSTADINASGSGFVYVNVSDYTLSASTVYYLMSHEDAGGDLWYDNDQEVVLNAAVTLNNASYTVANTGVPSEWTANTAYVPPSFTFL